MKQKLALLLSIILIAASFTGCTAKPEVITLDKSSVPIDYTASYKITTDNADITYTNVYTVSVDNEKNQLVISSLADEPWSNKLEGDDRLEGRQVIKTLSRLNYSGNFGVPDYIEQEFTVDVDKKFYTMFTFEHDHSINAGFLKIKEYAKSTETEYEETLYTVSLTEQYFDKDSLPFIISSFTSDEGVIMVSSGNRNTLQRVHYSITEAESVTVEAGTFSCKKVILRPDAVFSVNHATIWFDAKTGHLIKVAHDSSVMELKSLEAAE